MSILSSLDNGHQLLLSEIQSIVGEAWNITNAPIVLAKVGTVLSGEAKDFLNNVGKKLKPYILINMKDTIRYIDSSKYGDFAAPLTASENISDEELVHRYEKYRSEFVAARSNARFKSDIWNGFTFSVQTGRRFIHFDDYNHAILKYSPQIDDSGGDLYEILQSDLAFDADGNRVPYQRVGELILDWADRNNIPHSKLYATRDNPLERGQLRKVVEHDKKTSKEIQTIDNLIEAMNLLSKEELCRISVPADVVVKLIALARKQP